MGSEEVSYQLNASIYTSDEPFMPDFHEEEYTWYTNNYSKDGSAGLPFDSTVSFPVELKAYGTPTTAYNISNNIKFKAFEIGNVINFQSTNTSLGMNPKFSVYRGDALRSYFGSISFMSHQVEKDKWSLKSTFLHQYYELIPESKFINFYSSYSDGYKFSGDNAFKLEEQFTYDFSEKNNLIIGATAEHFDAIANTSDLPNPCNKSIDVDEQQVEYIGTNITDKFGNDLTIY
jgi:hypothetical protein